MQNGNGENGDETRVKPWVITAVLLTAVSLLVWWLKSSGKGRQLGVALEKWAEWMRGAQS